MIGVFGAGAGASAQGEQAGPRAMGTPLQRMAAILGPLAAGVTGWRANRQRRVHASCFGAGQIGAPAAARRVRRLRLPLLAVMLLGAGSTQALAASAGCIGATGPKPSSSATRRARSQRSRWVIPCATVLMATYVWPTYAIAAITFSGSTSTTNGAYLDLDAFNLYVGYSSTDASLGLGTLTISEGSDYSTGFTYIGYGADTNGVVTVTGAGSTLIQKYYYGSNTDSTGDIYVGYSGTGIIIIEDGGSVDSQLASYIGYNSGSDGSVYVIGENSTWTTGNYLYVGYSGSGTLTIEDGGTVTSTYGTTIAAESGSEGEVTVTGDGSSLTITGSFYVGEKGEGTLTIENGGTVTSGVGTGSNGTAAIGLYSDSSGTVTVTGEGSSWSISDGLVVGGFGTGTLTIADGGAVSAATVEVGDYSDGTVTVTGEDSSLTITGDLYLGWGSETETLRGDATLTIADGGVVSAGAVELAMYTYSSGTIIIGAAAGEEAVAAGTLDTDTVTFGAGDGTIVFNHTDTAYEFAADLVSSSSGAGAIDVYSGTTILSGDNSDYSGTTSLYGGTLSLSSADNLGTGALVFDGGTLQTTDSFTLANTITLGDDGGTFETASGTTLTVSSDLSGNGTLTKTGAGTLVLSGDSTYAGATTVSGGTLEVDGSIVSDVLVYATLTGTGTVGSVVVKDGGTLSPGSTDEDVGTLTVDGDLTFESGSTYAVDLSGTTGDSVEVSGDVTINSGATLTITALDSSTSYQVGQTYTIITADSVTGEFTTIDDDSLTDLLTDYIFLEVSADYSDDSVTLTISSVSDAFETVAETANQQAVAASLDSLEQSGDSLALYNSLLTITSAEEARAVYQELSGAIYTTAQSVLVENGQTVNGMVNNRLLGAFGNEPASAPAGTVLGYAEETQSPLDEPFAAFEEPAREQSPFTVWGSGFGSWGGIAGVDGEADAATAAVGYLLGADSQLDDTWTVGLFGGQSASAFGSSQESGTSDNIYAGAYAGAQWGALSFRSVASYGWYDVRTSRYVSLLNETLEGTYNANGMNASGELSYRFGDAAAIEPFANLAYSHLTTDAFTESGGTAALSVDSNIIDTTFTTLGVRASTQLDLASLMTTLQGMVGWRHAFGDTDTLSTARFETGDAFTISGTPIAVDALVLDIGLDAAISDNATLGLSYSGQFAADTQSQDLRGTLSVSF